jgi:hypothetical protein
MIDYVLGLWANKWLAFGLYWLPLAFCAVGYVVRTARGIVDERELRAAAELDPDRKFYIPQTTIGTLIGRGIVSVIPIANFCAAAFDLAPEFFGSFFRWVGRVFDQPLVPKRGAK